MMRPVLTIVFLVAMVTVAHGQGQVEEVPNPMAVHTYFIILFIAAFLAWAVSFSLHTMKERSLGQDHQKLKNIRESILDEIARIETEKESGDLSEAQYKQRMRELRGELSGIIEKLGSASKLKKKHA